MSIKLSTLTNAVRSQPTQGGSRGIFDAGHRRGRIQDTGGSALSLDTAIQDVVTTAEHITIATPGNALSFSNSRFGSPMLFGSAASEGTYASLHMGAWQSQGFETKTEMEFVNCATGNRAVNFERTIDTLSHAAASDGHYFVYIGGTTSVNSQDRGGATDLNRIEFFSIASPVTKTRGMTGSACYGLQAGLSDGSHFLCVGYRRTGADLHGAAVTAPYGNNQSFRGVLQIGVQTYWNITTQSGSLQANGWTGNLNHELGAATTDGYRVISHSFHSSAGGYSLGINTQIWYSSFGTSPAALEFGDLSPGTVVATSSVFPTSAMVTDGSRVVIQTGAGDRYGLALGNRNLQQVNITTPANSQQFGQTIEPYRRRSQAYSGA